MKSIKPALIACLLTTLCAVSASADGTSERATHGCKSVYVDAVRMNQAIVSAREWQVGQIASPTAIRSSASSGNLLETSSQPVTDCSDADFKCVRSWGRTLAIPREGLRSHQSYKKDGVTFVVDDCLRLDGKLCVVALISGRCALVKEDGSCAPTKQTGASNSKYENVDYFVYNQDFGVTALGSTDRLHTSFETRLAIASELILTSNEGIFGCVTP